MRCISLKELILFISICHISQEMKDILEEIQTNEDNPSELNAFFEDVMKFKKAFKLIRRAAAETDGDSMSRDRRDKDIDEYVYDEDNFVANTKKPHNEKHAPSSSNNMSPLRESSRPLNDIYPHIYKEHSDQDYVDKYLENFNFDKGPRYRRQLAEDVEVEPKSTKGNIAVVGEKATMVNSKTKGELMENGARETLMTIFGQLGQSTHPTHEITTPSSKSDLSATDTSNSQRTIDVPANIILTPIRPTNSEASPIAYTKRSADVQKDKTKRELKIDIIKNGKLLKEYSSNDNENESLSYDRPKQASISLNIAQPNVKDVKKDHTDCNKNNLKGVKPDPEHFENVESLEIPPSASEMRRAFVPTEFVEDIPKFVGNIMDEIETKYRGVPKITRSHRYHYRPYMELVYSEDPRSMYYTKNLKDMIYNKPYYQRAIQRNLRNEEIMRDDSEMQPQDNIEYYRSRSLKSFNDAQEDLHRLERNAQEILGMDNEDDYIEDLSFKTESPSTIKSAEEDDAISSSRTLVEKKKNEAKTTPTNYASALYPSTSTPAAFLTTTSTLVPSSSSPSATTAKTIIHTKIPRKEKTRKYRMMKKRKLLSRLRKRCNTCQADKREMTKENIYGGDFSSPRLRRHRFNSKRSIFDENHFENMHRQNRHDPFFVPRNLRDSIRLPRYKQNYNNDKQKSYYSSSIWENNPDPSEMYQKMRYFHFRPYSSNYQSRDIYPNIYEDGEGRVNSDYLKPKYIQNDRRRRRCIRLMARSNCSTNEHAVRKRDVIDGVDDDEVNDATDILEKRTESDYGEEPDLSEGQNFKKHSKLKKYSKVTAPSKNFDDNYEYEEVPNGKSSSFLGLKKNCSPKKKCKKKKHYQKNSDHHNCQMSFRDRLARFKNKLFSCQPDETEKALREEIPYKDQNDEYRRSERQSEPTRLKEKNYGFSGSSRMMQSDADADNTRQYCDPWCNPCDSCSPCQRPCNPCPWPCPCDPCPCKSCSSAPPPCDPCQPCSFDPVDLPPPRPCASCPCPPPCEPCPSLCTPSPKFPTSCDPCTMPEPCPLPHPPPCKPYSCTPPWPSPNTFPDVEDMETIVSHIKERCPTTYFDPCPPCDNCPSCSCPLTCAAACSAPGFTSSEEVKDDKSIEDDNQEGHIVGVRSSGSYPNSMYSNGLMDYDKQENDDEGVHSMNRRCFYIQNLPDCCKPFSFPCPNPNNAAPCPCVCPFEPYMCRCPRNDRISNICGLCQYPCEPCNCPCPCDICPCDSCPGPCAPCPGPCACDICPCPCGSIPCPSPCDPCSCPCDPCPRPRYPCPCPSIYKREVPPAVPCIYPCYKTEDEVNIENPHIHDIRGRCPYPYPNPCPDPCSFPCPEPCCPFPSPCSMPWPPPTPCPCPCPKPCISVQSEIPDRLQLHDIQNPNTCVECNEGQSVEDDDLGSRKVQMSKPFNSNESEKTGNPEVDKRCNSNYPSWYCSNPLYANPPSSAPPPPPPNPPTPPPPCQSAQPPCASCPSPCPPCPSTGGTVAPPSSQPNCPPCPPCPPPCQPCQTPCPPCPSACPPCPPPMQSGNQPSPDPCEPQNSDYNDDNADINERNDRYSQHDLKFTDTDSKEELSKSTESESSFSEDGETHNIKGRCPYLYPPPCPSLTPPNHYNGDLPPCPCIPCSCPTPCPPLDPPCFLPSPSCPLPCLQYPPHPYSNSVPSPYSFQYCPCLTTSNSGETEEHHMRERRSNIQSSNLKNSETINGGHEEEQLINDEPIGKREDCPNHKHQTRRISESNSHSDDSHLPKMQEHGSEDYNKQNPSFPGAFTCCLPILSPCPCPMPSPCSFPTPCPTPSGIPLSCLHYDYVSSPYFPFMHIMSKRSDNACPPRYLWVEPYCCPYPKSSPEIPCPCPDVVCPPCPCPSPEIPQPIPIPCTPICTNPKPCPGTSFDENEPHHIVKRMSPEYSTSFPENDEVKITKIYSPEFPCPKKCENVEEENLHEINGCRQTCPIPHDACSYPCPCHLAYPMPCRRQTQNPTSNHQVDECFVLGFLRIPSPCPVKIPNPFKSCGKCISCEPSKPCGSGAPSGPSGTCGPLVLCDSCIPCSCVEPCKRDSEHHIEKRSCPCTHDQCPSICAHSYPECHTSNCWGICSPFHDTNPRSIPEPLSFAETCCFPYSPVSCAINYGFPCPCTYLQKRSCSFPFPISVFLPGTYANPGISCSLPELNPLPSSSHYPTFPVPCAVTYSIPCPYLGKRSNGFFPCRSYTLPCFSQIFNPSVTRQNKLKDAPDSSNLKKETQKAADLKSDSRSDNGNDSHGAKGSTKEEKSRFKRDWLCPKPKLSRNCLDCLTSPYCIESVSFNDPYSCYEPIYQSPYRARPCYNCFGGYSCNEPECGGLEPSFSNPCLDPASQESEFSCPPWYWNCDFIGPCPCKCPSVGNKLSVQRRSNGLQPTMILPSTASTSDLINDPDFENGDKEKRKCPKPCEPLPPFSACSPPLPLPCDDTTNDMLAQKARQVNAYLKNQYLNGRYTMNNPNLPRNRRQLSSVDSSSLTRSHMEPLDRQVRRPHGVPKKPPNKKLPTKNDVNDLEDIDDNNPSGQQESGSICKGGNSGLGEQDHCQMGKIHRRNCNGQNDPNPEARTKSDLNPEDFMLLRKKSNSEYQDMHFAKEIVEAVMNKVNKNTNLKIKIGNALNKKRIYETEKNQRNYAKECSFEERAEYEEAKNLLRSVSCVLNKLVKKQIEEKLCEKLPGHLKSFLKRIVRPPKHRIHQRHDDKYHEDTFLFRASCPPAKLDPDTRSQLEVNLVKLLDRYNQLDEDSRKRAAPLRSYISNHLGMLKKINDDGYDTETMSPDGYMESNDAPQAHTRRNPSDTKLDSSQNYRNFFNNLDTMDKDLENLDLNKIRTPFQQPPSGTNNFTPVKISEEDNSMENKLKKRNADKLAKSETSPHKRETDDDLTSDKYKKLVKAAEEVRVKRKNEEKIGEAFGNKKVDQNDPDAKDQDDQVAFETPLVYRP